MRIIPPNNLIFHKRHPQFKTKPLRRITHSKPCRTLRDKRKSHLASSCTKDKACSIRTIDEMTLTTVVVESGRTVEAITAHHMAAIVTETACTQATDVSAGHLGKASIQMSSTKDLVEEATAQEAEMDGTQVHSETKCAQTDGNRTIGTIIARRKSTRGNNLSA